MPGTLVVHELFLSLQGESTFAGLPCVFVRLTGCNLRCSYCDTAYAFTGGSRMSIDEVRAAVRLLAGPYLDAARDRLPLVEVTGGEPLIQDSTLPLLESLCDDGFTVLLETNGAIDISAVDGRVRRIIDLKCPSSGESDRNCWGNIGHLRPADEVKFVIATREDYEWAKTTMAKHRLAAICDVLFSWAAPLEASQHAAVLKPVPAGHSPMGKRELAEAIIHDSLPARFQLQMHKLIWPPDQRGV